MKRCKRPSVLYAAILSLLLLTIGTGTVTAATHNATVRKTYVDLNDPDYSFGEIAQGTASVSGYNCISDGTVDFGNTGWGANYITYVEVDASAIRNSGMVTGATMTLWVTGSTDSKRQTTWGVGYNSSTWTASMTYNTADRSIITVGQEVTTSTSKADTWEQVTFDITDALTEDADKVVTLIIYETAAAGGYVDVSSVVVEYAPYHAYTVQSSVNSTVLATGTVAEGLEVTAHYPRYQLSGTSLYKVPDHETANPHYGRRFVVTTDDQVETINYSTYAENIVFYREAEDFLTPVAGNSNIYNRCSGTAGGYARNYADVVTGLPSGAYKITAGSYANTSTTFTFQTGGATVFTQTGNGMWQETTSSTFQVSDGSPIQVVGGNNNYALDYVYVQRIFGYTTASSNRTYNKSGKPGIVIPTGLTVTYSSNNTAVATVSDQGDFQLTFEGKAGVYYRGGNFQIKNGTANSTEQNGVIIITPRFKEGRTTTLNFRSVKLNIGATVRGTPEINVNGKTTTITAANSEVIVDELEGSTLRIELTSTGAKDAYLFLLNSITFTYDIGDDTALDDSKGTIDLKFAKEYVYGHTGDAIDNAAYFDSPRAFYGDAAFTYAGGSGFHNDNTSLSRMLDDNKRFTHFKQDEATEYQVVIGEGVCHLSATFAETDYFAASTATTRLYSYDYVEEPALVLAPGESYTVPAASGLSFSLTTTGSSTLTLTGTTVPDGSPSGTTLEGTATAAEVVIANSGSDPVTITRIEVKRMQPQLSFAYTGGQGDEGDVFFPGDSCTPTTFAVKEGDTDISDKYETTGTYEIVRAVESVTINPSTGQLTVGSNAANGWLDVQLTVAPNDANKDLYGPVTTIARVTIVGGYWDFTAYKYADHQRMNGSAGWSANNYNQARDTEFFETFLQNDGNPLPQAIGLESRYKMRMTYAKNNGPGRLHLFGKGSNEQNRARYGYGGILRVPVKKGMQIEINAYSNGQQSEMNLDGCSNLTGTADVTTFYVDETSASQFFIANRDGYIDIINLSSNLDLYINYIKLTSDMVFFYGNETYIEPGGTFSNPVINQGETTLSYSYTSTTSGNICEGIDANGTVTQRVGAYGSYKVTVTGSGAGLLAGKTGEYTVHTVGFTVVSPVTKQIDASLKTTFTPKDDITIVNSSGLDEDALKAKVQYSFMSKTASVAYFSGDNLIIEGIGDVVLQARLGAITRTMAYRVIGASLNDEAPVITNAQGSYTVVIQGGDAGSFVFDTDRMTDGMLGNLNKPTFTQNGNTLTISNITGEGGIIPIYAHCTYGGASVDMEGVLTVAYSHHLWNFEGDLLPSLANWTPKNTGTWTNACTFEEPVDASANNVDTKDWCFVRKMGVTHPESSIIYYYNHSVIGTNALVMPETQGLYLRTTQSGKQLGVEMDNERISGVGVPRLTNGNYAARNLMILRGGQVVIPKVKPGQ